MPIINYSCDQRDKLIRFWKRHPHIKDSKEGSLYLIDNEVYKIYYEEESEKNPICRENLYLETFLFPTEIYMHNGKVFGYKTPYIEKNLLGYKKMVKGWNPDIVQFKKALDQFIFDTFVISMNHIETIDFVFRNTIYDGNKFYIIDTLNYQVTDEDTLPENIDKLKSIIKCFVLDYNLATELRCIPKDENALKEVNGLEEYIENKFQELIKTYQDEDIKKMRG